MRRTKGSGKSTTCCCSAARLLLFRQSVKQVMSGYSISTDKRRLQLPVIHDFLRESYWAKDIPESVVRRSVDEITLFWRVSRPGTSRFAQVLQTKPPSPISPILYHCCTTKGLSALDGEIIAPCPPGGPSYAAGDAMRTGFMLVSVQGLGNSRPLDGVAPMTGRLPLRSSLHYTAHSL